MSQENLMAQERKDNVLTVEELRRIYGKRQRWRRGDKKKYASKRLFACALLGFLTCIVLAVITFIFYARPVSVIGTRRFYEENVDIYHFIRERILYIEEIGIALSGQDEEAILQAFGVIQSAVALLFAALTIIVFLIYLILAAVRFALRKDTVACALIGMVKWGFVVCIIYPFFVNTSGGSGDAFYSVGFAPGIGTIVGISLGLVALCVCSILMEPEYRNVDWRQKKQRKTAFIVAVICTCGSGICYALPLQSVFLYMLSSALLSAMGNAVGGSVSISGIVFPILNLALFVLTISAYRLLLGGAVKNWKSLVSSSAFDKYLTKLRLHRQRVGPLFAPALLSALALACAFVLQQPSIGFGWDVQLIVPLIAIVVICSVGTLAYIIWNKCADKLLKQNFANQPSITN